MPSSRISRRLSSGTGIFRFVRNLVKSKTSSFSTPGATDHGFPAVGGPFGEIFVAVSTISSDLHVPSRLFVLVKGPLRRSRCNMVVAQIRETLPVSAKVIYSYVNGDALLVASRSRGYLFMGAK